MLPCIPAHCLGVCSRFAIQGTDHVPGTLTSLALRVSFHFPSLLSAFCAPHGYCLFVTCDCPRLLLPLQLFGSRTDTLASCCAMGPQSGECLSCRHSVTAVDVLSAACCWSMLHWLALVCLLALMHYTILHTCRQRIRVRAHSSVATHSLQQLQCCVCHE